MPYSAEHKQATRGRIVDCARELFNLKGFTEVTVNEIMLLAGLTHGGFYNHFASKDELYVEAVQPNNQCSSMATSLDGLELAEQVINAYVSKTHLEDIKHQCPMIALPSDIARSGPEVKQAYEVSLNNMASVFEGISFRTGSKKSRQRALGLVALCVGGMVIARTVDNKELAEEIRKAALETAKKLVKQT